MKLENQNIIIVSNEAWGDIWYSKHNYAFELAKKNKVYFLNPPKPFSLRNFFASSVQEIKAYGGITVLEYSNILPVSLLNFWKLNDKIILKRLKKFFTKKNIHDLIFWTFDPIRLAFPELINPKLIIFHAVDDYFFSYPSEALLAGKADHIFCVSDKFVEKYKKYCKNIAVLPHAIPDDEFLPVSSKRNNLIKGVFVGKMDYRINPEFNLKIFKAFPSIQFTIVGQLNNEFKNLFEKENLKNVTLIQPVKSAEIKNYVSGADFCFIFKKIYKGNNIFSHKLLQYLAQGKPIFGTDFSDFNEEVKNNLYLSNSSDEMIKMIKVFSDNEEPAGKAEIRIKFAKQNTFSVALSIVENALKLQSKSNAYLYYANISFKTRLFNFFKKALANPVIDPLLASLTFKEGAIGRFALSIIPLEYLYPNPSKRKYRREGIKMDLNISNLVDHYVYYSINKTPIIKFISYLKPGSTVIDVGTNIGYTTLLLSRACPHGKIIGIEPSIELFKTLEDHVKLNAFTNVKCLNIGLGEKNKTVRLYKVNETNNGMNRIFENNNIPLNSERITIKTLDEVVSEENMYTIDALKIDVEGYELKVLQGAMNVLKNHHPVLLVEIDSENLKEQQASPNEIFKLLFELDYSIFDVRTMHRIELGQDYTGVHFDAICFKGKT